MARIFYDEDAVLSILDGSTVGIIGYGNQGRAWAMNLRDSGVQVIVGNVRDSYWDRAVADGFHVYGISEAVERSDIVCILIPDEVQKTVYRSQVEPYMKSNGMIVFAHGFSIRYGLINPRRDVDVALLAPRMIGVGVRKLYESGYGAPAFVAVKQDATGVAWPKILALAKALGFTRAGVIESSFEEETELDLFTEQAVMPIIISTFLKAYEILVSRGYSVEAVLTELIASGELIEVFRQVCKLGLMSQLILHSKTSQYGQLSRIGRYIDRIHEPMVRSLEEIASGVFSEEWVREQELGYLNFRRLLEEALSLQIEKDSEDLRRRLRIPYDML
ncbi:MAG: ketol-acid reductoisomerase [Candidatus Bathyarchaeota archaeon]|nr:ketol-acid reductoisomerase [Candidatus Bathyarchaeota archaeon]